MDDHGTATAAVEINILAKVLNSLVKRDLERRLQSHGVNLGTLPYGVLHDQRAEAQDALERGNAGAGG